MTLTSLIPFPASSLHKRSCPQPGRYTVLDLVSSPQLKLAHRHRRFAGGRAGWQQQQQQQQMEHHEETNETPPVIVGVPADDCQNADVQIGCTSSGQNEMIIQESCKRNDGVAGERGMCMGWVHGWDGLVFSEEDYGIRIVEVIKD